MIRQENYNLTGRNTFRMKVKCALYVEIEREEDLPALEWDALPQPVMVMGGGSNLLFTADFPGTVLHVGIGSGLGLLLDQGPAPVDVAQSSAKCQFSGLGLAYEMGPGPKVTLGAGVIFDDFCAWAAAEGLWGPENLSLIPGEVGASAVQNIGAYGVEAKDIIAGIHAWDRMEGRFVDIDPADCAYGYRTSKFKTEWKGRYIITAVTYRLSKTPHPKLDYGGVRKALELTGVGVCPSETCAPPHKGRGRGPLETSSCKAGTQETVGGAGTERSGVEFSEGHTPTALTPQLIRDTIIGIRNQKLPDPAVTGSAGSFFCNPVISREHFAKIVETARKDNGPEYEVPHYVVGDNIKVPAAWMIEQCGFKGAVNGGAQVYPKQPLVIVNASGSATPQEIIGLEQRIIDTIAGKYGITLHPEVEHVGSPVGVRD